ncbi:hypothetical protein D9613_012405 [Agrocybe pediades]|uniref:Uncharacterized protein n=1 Tax=Agrocybe pediades TaxID=84607 RepID=A0A8H4VPM9_9AGAR|nr:hypothetical protein D9613_012405 [Agrocybe pediades]
MSYLKTSTDLGTPETRGTRLFRCSTLHRQPTFRPTFPFLFRILDVIVIVTQSGDEPHELSCDNCPSVFVPTVLLWAETVPTIQGLIPEAQQDLVRVCSSTALCLDTCSVIAPGPGPVTNNHRNRS